MSTNQDFIQALNRVLQAHGFTNATEHRIVVRGDQLQLALTSRTTESAEANVRNNLFLLTDRYWNWHESFVYLNHQIWLIDFDSRRTSPWVCTDSQSNIYFLSTNLMRKYAIADNEPTTGRLPNNSPARVLKLAESYATWG